MKSWELPDIDLAENVPGSLVHANPLVYLLGLNSGTNAPGLLSHDSFLDHPVRHFFFMNPMWSLSSNGYKERVIPRLNDVVARFSQHCYVLFVNDPDDLRIRTELDARVAIHVCGEHALADVNRFAFQPDKIEFNATYIAQNAAYKRIELAREINRVCLISKGIEQGEVEELHDTMPSLFCPNAELGLLDSKQVSMFLNRSKAGLILSQIEGQNRATIEYLLCGLPVVSTHNRGGRDRFLTPANSLYVPDDPTAIAEAVDFVGSANFDRAAIAQHAVDSIRRERAWLSHIVDTTLSRHGLEPISIKSSSLPHHGFSSSNSMAHVLQKRYLAVGNT